MTQTKTSPRESRWREGPLLLAGGTLVLALLGKNWIVNSLQQPVLLLVLLGRFCGVILMAADACW